MTDAGEVSTVAGLANLRGNADGVGSAATFWQPHGIAVDTSGNAYVGNLAYAVRRVTPGGVVTSLSGIVGTDVAVDADGTVYATNRYTVLKRTSAGVVTTLAGLAGTPGSADGTGSEARFNNARGIAIAPSGDLYVTDSLNHNIRKITPDGVVTTLAGLAGSSGDVDATGTAARFKSPVAVAVDGTGTLFVADQDNNKIRKVTPTGVVTTLAGAGSQFGYADGPGAVAKFWRPQGVAVAPDGSIYVSEASNMIRRVTAAGVVTTVAGLGGGVAGSEDGVGSAARFNSPYGLAFDTEGRLYIAEFSGNRIRTAVATGPTALTVVTKGSGGGEVTSSTPGISCGADCFEQLPSGTVVSLDGDAASGVGVHRVEWRVHGYRAVPGGGDGRDRCRGCLHAPVDTHGHACGQRKRDRHEFAGWHRLRDRLHGGLRAVPGEPADYPHRDSRPWIHPRRMDVAGRDHFRVCQSPHVLGVHGPRRDRHGELRAAAAHRHRCDRRPPARWRAGRRSRSPGRTSSRARR